MSLVFFGLNVLSQESLSPLRYNQALLKDTSLEKSSSPIHESFIYLFDTIHLPIIDDFSTNKFKVFDAEIGDPRVSDTTWYALDSNGFVPFTTSYMTDTTYDYQYDTIAGFGFDSIIEISIPTSPGLITVYDLASYPITSSIVEVWVNRTTYDSLWSVASPDYAVVSSDPDLAQDTVTLYFVDTNSKDAGYVWKDRYTFRNNNYPVNPLSLGVATFDGLDENGYPYDWSSASAKGLADQLTSKPIFLQTDPGGGTYLPIDSIYLSFVYQPGGRGEDPDPQDSLVLEFYAVDQDEWRSIWKTNGFSSNEWEVVNILIDSSDYFKDGFQFRFKNYGSLTGGLDHWHIDYVILDDFRSFDDTTMNDWAFQYPLNSMLKDYTSMPWKHYEQDPYSTLLDTFSVKTYNSYTGAKILQPSFMELIYEGLSINTVPYLATVTNVSPLSSFNMFYDPDPSFYFDTTLADTFALFDVKFNLATNTTPERLNVNDTLLHQQKFYNYYAYDDGSAEAAYGLVSNGAELAYQFELPAGLEDTIKSIFIHFSPSVNDASADPFFLQIWEDLGGEPGDTIYSTDDVNLPVTYVPEYNLGVDGFYEYILPQKVAVSGTYYVGWKQTTANRLNIGFDKNINNQDKIFYNLGSGWNNTGFEGSLMMRPVFVSDMDAVFAGLSPIIDQSDFSLYPNPAQDQLIIDISDQTADFSIFDLNGRLIEKGNIRYYQSLDVSYYNNGVYLILLNFENGSIGRKKIVIQH